MEEAKNKIANTITIFVTMLSIVLPSFFFIVTSSEKITTQTYVIFIGILMTSIAGIIIYYFYSKWEETTKRTIDNSKTIKDIKRDINTQNLFNDMEKRLSVMEALSKSKKAMIDPRILFAIVLAILLFLFLKSINFFG